MRTDLAKGTTAAPISIATHGEETMFYMQSLVLKPGQVVVGTLTPVRSTRSSRRD